MRKQLPCPPMLQHPCLERALAQAQRRRTPIWQAAPRAMHLQMEVCTNHPDANPSDTVMLPQVACSSSLSPQTAPSDTLTAQCCAGMLSSACCRARKTCVLPANPAWQLNVKHAPDLAGVKAEETSGATAVSRGAQDATKPPLIIRNWGSVGGGFVPFGAGQQKIAPKGGKILPQGSVKAKPSAAIGAALGPNLVLPNGELRQGFSAAIPCALPHAAGHWAHALIASLALWA